MRQAIDLPLHYGRTPEWLFEKMRRLARVIIEIIVEEFGANDFLKKVSDPGWFQSLGCLLGFDWHSSGLTTTTSAAIKLGIKGIEKHLGIYAVGGKGKQSRKIPEEISEISNKIGVDEEKLIYSSRMAAKVDSGALQDGYQVYHQLFLFTPQEFWVCINQGMNPKKGWARRYHWLAKENLKFVEEPHTGILGKKENKVLNLVAKESKETREVSTKLTYEPEKTLQELKKIMRMPKRHPIHENFDIKRLKRILLTAYEIHPENYEKLLAINGVGAKTLRALALTSEIIYGTKSSYEDPVSYSYAHGGKDGYPYPVDRKSYETTINVFERAIKRTKLGRREELELLKKLPKLINQ